MSLGTLFYFFLPQFPHLHSEKEFFLFLLVIYDIRIHFDIILKAWDRVCSNSVPGTSPSPCSPLSTDLSVIYLYFVNILDVGIHCVMVMYVHMKIQLGSSHCSSLFSFLPLPAQSPSPTLLIFPLF